MTWMLALARRVLALSLIGAASFAPHPARADDLRVGLSADVTSMDPHWNNSGPNIAVSRAIFEPLVGSDRDGRLVPELAVSWRNIDPLTWEFKLRPGVKFQDGAELTPEDVLFSLERPLSLSGSPGPFTQFVKMIAGKQIVDRTTIRIKTSAPYVLLPEDLNSICIVEKKVAEHATPADFDSGRAAIGTGPYRLVRFARGDRIELVRNPGYWGAQPAFEHVTLRLLTADEPRLAALLSGEVDAIENIPPQDIAELKSNSRFQIDQRVSWRTLFWHMDQFRDQTPDVTDRAGRPLAHNPFKDHRVRLAISKAINRSALVERVMENLAMPASNLVSPGIFGHNDAIPVEPYDPAGAKKLLAEAGYPDGFNLVLHAPNNRYVNDARVAEAVAGMLTRVGITTKVVTQPWSTYLAHAHDSEYSFSMLGWGSVLGDNTIRSQLATPDPAKGYGTWNFGRYSNPKLDQMVDHDFTLFDAQARDAYAQSMMAFAMSDTPVIVMYHQLASWAVRRGIRYPGRVDEFTLAQDFEKE